MDVESVKFILWVKDMDRAVAFYRDVIGLYARLHTPHWSELAFGEAVVALHAGGDGTYRPTGLGIQVTDLDAACREVEAGGGRVRTPPQDRPGEPVRLADLEDPEGNGFQLSQYVG